MQESQTHFNTRWCKENPDRKSHDTILFTDLNFLVQKPGTSNEVFTLLERDNTLFLGPNSFTRVCQMYQHKYSGSPNTPNQNPPSIISAIQFSRVSVIDDKQNGDISLLKTALTKFRSQEKQRILQELKESSQYQPQRSPFFIECSKCGRKFRQMSEFLYHRFLCVNPSESFELGRIIQEFGVPNTAQPQCFICPRRFMSDKFCYLHFDTHVQRGHLYPCYPCGRQGDI